MIPLLPCIFDSSSGDKWKEHGLVSLPCIISVQPVKVYVPTGAGPTLGIYYVDGLSLPLPLELPL